MSYNVDYVSSANTNTVEKLSNYMTLSESGSNEDQNNTDFYSTTGVDSFDDAFVLINPTKAIYSGSALSDTNCANCFVACACNTANGWSATKPAGAYYKATVGFNMGYKSTDDSARTSSATEIRTSGTQTLISEGTSGAYNISTMATTSSSAYNVVAATEPLSCYKQKDSYFSCVYNWVSKPVRTSYAKKYTNNRDEFNFVEATFDEYFLDSMTCTNSNDNTKVTYNSTSTPTLSKVLTSANRTPKFEVNIAYDFISFEDQAKYDEQSAIIPASKRGQTISWRTTAEQGLFSSFQSVRADITFDAYLSSTSYFDGYVLVKPGKNTTKRNVMTHKALTSSGYKNNLTTNTSAFDNVAYIYWNKENGIETSEFAVTAGEAATRNLYEQGWRFTNFKSGFGVDSTNTPEIIRLYLSEKNNLRYGGVDYFMSNYTIKKQGQSVLADRIFDRKVDTSARIYATYNRDSDGTITSKDSNGYTKTSEVYTVVDFNDGYTENYNFINVVRDLKYKAKRTSSDAIIKCEHEYGHYCQNGSGYYTTYKDNYSTPSYCPKTGYTSHSRSLTYGMFNWDGLSIQEDVRYERCDGLREYCNDCTSTSPISATEEEVYEDIGSSHNGVGVLVYRGGKLIRTDSDYEDVTCPSGYYKNWVNDISIDSDYFNITWDATETCYKVNGCKTNLDTKYAKGEIVNLTNKTPARSTIVYNETALDGTRCAVYDCPEGYYYSKEKPYSSYFTVVEQIYGSYLNAKRCYKLECKQDGYEASTSLPDDNCYIDSGYSSSYRQYYCDNHKVYTPCEGSGFYCIKKTSDCPGGWTTEEPNSSFFNYQIKEVKKSSGGTQKCYYVTGCASGSTQFYTLPKGCKDDGDNVKCKRSSYIPLEVKKLSDGVIDFNDDYTVGYSHYEKGTMKFACLTNNKCDSGYYFSPRAMMTTSNDGFIYQSQSTDKPYCNKSIGCSRLNQRFYSSFNSEVMNTHKCTTTYFDSVSIDTEAQCANAHGYYDPYSNAFCLEPYNTNTYYFYADNEMEKSFITGILNRSGDTYNTSGFQNLSIYEAYGTSGTFGKLFSEDVPSDSSDYGNNQYRYTCSAMGDSLLYTCAGNGNTSSTVSRGGTHQYIAINTNSTNVYFSRKGRSGKRVYVSGSNSLYYNLSNACPYYDSGYTSLNYVYIDDPRVVTYEPDQYSVCTKATCNTGYVKIPLDYPTSDDYSEGGVIHVAEHANLKSSYKDKAKRRDYGDAFIEMDGEEYPYSPAGLLVGGNSACVKEKYCAGTKTFNTKTLIGYDESTCEPQYITPGKWCTNASEFVLLAPISAGGYQFTRDQAANIPSAFKLTDTNTTCFKNTTYNCKYTTQVIFNTTDYKKTGSTITVNDVNNRTHKFDYYTYVGGKVTTDTETDNGDVSVKDPILDFMSVSWYCVTKPDGIQFCCSS